MVNQKLIEDIERQAQATVAIKDKQWSVVVASTYAELTSGLSGVSSIPPQTGMLFDLGYDQTYITIDMTGMLFPLDIIFINSYARVRGVMRDVQPNYTDVRFEADGMPGARFFLEVNAGEAQGIEVGDDVAIQGYVQTTQLDISSLVNFTVIMMVIVMMFKVVNRALKPEKGPFMLGGGKIPQGYVPVRHSSKASERLSHSAKYPEHVKMASEITDFIADAAANMFDVEGEVEEAVWDMKPISQRAHGLIDRAKDKAYRIASGTAGLPYAKEIQREYMPKVESYLEGIAEAASQVDAAIVRKDQDEATEFSHGVGDIARAIGHLQDEALIDAYERLSGEKVATEHHSMWLTPEQRKDLEKKYGAVTVRWAEEATRPGDIKGAEAAAEYYYAKLKEVFGLGHLSPELSEEQIRELREVLGLTADVAEVLKIHRETGYIP